MHHEAHRQILAILQCRIHIEAQPRGPMFGEFQNLALFEAFPGPNDFRNTNNAERVWLHSVSFQCGTRVSRWDWIKDSIVMTV
jgi:hypothetical protein